MLDVTLSTPGRILAGRGKEREAVGPASGVGGEERRKKIEHVGLVGSLGLLGAGRHYLHIPGSRREGTAPLDEPVDRDIYVTYGWSEEHVAIGVPRCLEKRWRFGRRRRCCPGRWRDVQPRNA